MRGTDQSDGKRVHPMLSRRARSREVLTIWGACLLSGLVQFLWWGTPGHPFASVAGIGIVLGTCAVMMWRTWRLARRVVAADSLLCVRCHYDLRGLDRAGDCPECGESYDLAELPSMWAQAIPSTHR